MPERYIDGLPLTRPQPRTHRNLGTCPDQESPPQPLGLQAGTQSTEPHRAGLLLLSSSSHSTLVKTQKPDRITSEFKIHNCHLAQSKGKIFYSDLKSPALSGSSQALKSHLYYSPLCFLHSSHTGPSML